MKVAINTEFGGFELSKEAFSNLLTRKGVAFEIETVDNWDRANFYQAGHLGNSDHFIGQYEYTNNRADADLVAVIDDMGFAAGGMYSRLKLVEIPDDVEFEIAEYDGIEHIAEKHRKWS
jgi:hypothetical protein